MDGPRDDLAGSHAARQTTSVPSRDNGTVVSQGIPAAMRNSVVSSPGLPEKPLWGRADGNSPAWPENVGGRSWNNRSGIAFGPEDRAGMA